MMTFGWSPLIEPTAEVTFRQNAVQFGDGYTQVTGDGLNNILRTWPLQFRGYGHEVQPIKAFIEAHAEGQRFLWTAPLDVPRRYRVAGYEHLAHGGNVHTISASFVEAP